MYDSTNPRDCPADAQLLGYYVDGIYAVSEAAARASHPNAVLVPISAIGTNAGIVGDVEPGCITVTDSVAWVRGRRGAGVDPTIYVNASTWGQVRAAFQSVGEREPHYWIADWRNFPDPTIPAGAVARQYGGSAQTGSHFDISSVADFWPGVDNMPTRSDYQAIHDAFQEASWGVIDPSPKSLDDFIWFVEHGHSLTEALAGWHDPNISTAAKAWRAKLATIGQPAPLAPPTSTDVTPLLTEIKTKIDALGKHLGVGTA